MSYPYDSTGRCCACGGRPDWLALTDGRVFCMNCCPATRRRPLAADERCRRCPRVLAHYDGEGRAFCPACWHDPARVEVSREMVTVGVVPPERDAQEMYGADAARYVPPIAAKATVSP